MANKNYSNWVKSFGRSVKFGAKEILSDMAPTIAETAGSLPEDIRELRQDIRKLRANKRQIVNYLIGEEENFSKYGKIGWQNIKSSWKTGKFIDPKRAERMTMEAMGMGDIDFEGDFEGTDSFDMNDNFEGESFGSVEMGPSKVVNLMGPATEAMTSVSDGVNGTTEAVTVGFQNLDRSNKNAFTISEALQKRFHSEKMGQLEAINSNLVNIITYNNETWSTYVKASMEFYDKNLELMTSMNDALLRMSPVPKEKKERVKEESPVDMFMRGGFSLKGYADFAAKNAKKSFQNNMLGSMIPLLNNEMILADFAANPLGSLMKLGIENWIIPDRFKKSLGSLDKSFNAFMPALMTKIGNYEGDNEVFKLLSEIFGVKTEVKTKRFKQGEYERGPIPFDGETKAAVTRIIPGYLSRIASVLEVMAKLQAKGMTEEQFQEEIRNRGMVYDDSREGAGAGSFMRFGEALKSQRREERDMITRSYSNARWELRTAMGQHEASKDINRDIDIDDFLVGLTHSNQELKPNDLDSIKEILQKGILNGKSLSDESYKSNAELQKNAEAIQFAIKALPYDVQMSLYGSERAEAKTNLNNYYSYRSSDDEHGAGRNTWLHKLNTGNIFNPYMDAENTQLVDRDWFIERNIDGNYWMPEYKLEEFKKKYKGKGNFKDAEDVYNYIQKNKGKKQETKKEETKEEPKTVEKTLTQQIKDILQAPLNKMADMFDKVNKAMWEIIFGKDGLGGNMKELILGKKDENGRYIGGWFSEAINSVKDTYTSTKTYLFGGTDSEGETKGILTNTMSKFTDMMSKYIFGEKKEEIGPDGKPVEKGSIVDRMKDTLVRGFSELSAMLFGTGKGKKGREKGIKEARETFNKAIPDIGKGAGLGLVIGSISGFGGFGLLGSLFLPGGPIGGAIVGGALGLLKQSKAFCEMIFGKEVVDKEGNTKHIGGLISDRMRNFFKRKKVAIGGGAVMGFVSNLLGHGVGFGLIPGVAIGAFGPVIMGAAWGLFTHSKKFREVIFGKETKDADGNVKKIGGLLNNKLMRGFKANLPRGIAGAVGGIATMGVVSQFGLIGSMIATGPIPAAILGAGLAIATGSRNFSRRLFGYTDGRGNYHSGYLDKAKNYFTWEIMEPLKLYVRKNIFQGKMWLRRYVYAPLRSAIVPLGYTFADIGKYLADKVKGVFDPVRAGFTLIFDTIADNILKIMNPIVKATSAMAKWMVGKFQTALKISINLALLPLRAFGGLLSWAVKNRDYKSAVLTAAKGVGQAVMAGAGVMGAVGKLGKAIVMPDESDSRMIKFRKQEKKQQEIEEKALAKGNLVFADAQRRLEEQQRMMRERGYALSDEQIQAMKEEALAKGTDQERLNQQIKDSNDLGLKMQKTIVDGQSEANQYLHDMREFYESESGLLFRQMAGTKAGVEKAGLTGESLKEKFSDVMENKVQPMVESIKEKISEVTTPVATILGEKVVTAQDVTNTKLETISGIMTRLLDVVKKAWNVTEEEKKTPIEEVKQEIAKVVEDKVAEAINPEVTAESTEPKYVSEKTGMISRRKGLIDRTVITKRKSGKKTDATANIVDGPEEVVASATITGKGSKKRQKQKERAQKLASKAKPITPRIQERYETVISKAGTVRKRTSVAPNIKTKVSDRYKGRVQKDLFDRKEVRKLSHNGKIDYNLYTSDYENNTGPQLADQGGWDPTDDDNAGVVDARNKLNKEKEAAIEREERRLSFLETISAYCRDKLRGKDKDKPSWLEKILGIGGSFISGIFSLGKIAMIIAGGITTIANLLAFNFGDNDTKRRMTQSEAMGNIMERGLRKGLQITGKVGRKAIDFLGKEVTSEKVVGKLYKTAENGERTLVAVQKQTVKSTRGKQIMESIANVKNKVSRFFSNSVNKADDLKGPIDKLISAGNSAIEFLSKTQWIKNPKFPKVKEILTVFKAVVTSIGKLLTTQAFRDKVLTYVAKKGGSSMLIKGAAKSALGVLTGGAAAVAFGIYDGISGAARAGFYFDINDEDTDLKMRMISGAINTFFGLPLMFAYDFGLSLISIGAQNLGDTELGQLMAKFGINLMNFDHRKALAQLMYRMMSDDADNAKLDDSQRKLLDQYKQYLNDNGLTEHNMSLEEYQDKVKGQGGIWKNFGAPILNRVFGIEDPFKGGKSFMDRVHDAYEGLVKWFKEAAEKIMNFSPLEFIKEQLSKVFDPIKERWDKFTDFSNGGLTDEHKHKAGTWNKFKSKVADFFTRDKETSFEGEGNEYYSQNDARWKNTKIGDMNIGEIGCAPASLAMVMSQISGKDITPKDTKKLITQEDLSDRGVKSDYFRKAANVTGLAYRENQTPEELYTAIKSGTPTIVGGMSSNPNSPFYGNGHYVVAKGMGEDGKVNVLNPTSATSSGRMDVDRLIKESLGSGGYSGSFSGGAPGRMTLASAAQFSDDNKDVDKTELEEENFASTNIADFKREEDTTSGKPLIINKQDDDRWWNHPYTFSSVSEGGCMPTSFTNMAQMFGKYITPTEATDFSGEAGFHNSDAGTELAFYPAASKRWNLPVHQIGSWGDVISDLKAGKPVAAGFWKGDGWSKYGHWMLMSKVEDDKVMVIDSRSGIPERHTGADITGWHSSAEAEAHWAGPGFAFGSDEVAKDNNFVGAGKFVGAGPGRMTLANAKFYANAKPGDLKLVNKPGILDARNYDTSKPSSDNPDADLRKVKEDAMKKYQSEKNSIDKQIEADDANIGTDYGTIENTAPTSIADLRRMEESKEYKEKTEKAVKESEAKAKVIKDNQTITGSSSTSSDSSKSNKKIGFTEVLTGIGIGLKNLFSSVWGGTKYEWVKSTDLFGGLKSIFGKSKGDRIKGRSGTAEYKQDDERWWNHPYTFSTVSEGGCMPTSFCNMASMYGVKVLPPEACDFSGAKGFHVQGGTACAFYPAAAEKWKVPVHAINSWEQVLSDLKSGHPVAAGFEGGDGWSKGGHWMLMTACDDEGRIYVVDSRRGVHNTGADITGWHDGRETYAHWAGPGYAFGADDVPKGGAGGSFDVSEGRIDTKKAVWNYLVNDLEFNRAGAAGVMGNIEQESHFNTSGIGDNGTSGGLVQWHDERPGVGRFTNLKNYASKIGKPWDDVNSQMGYLAQELNTRYRDVYDKVSNADNFGDAVSVWVKDFEIPADIPGEIAKRTPMAEAFYNDHSNFVGGANRFGQRYPSYTQSNSYGNIVNTMLTSWVNGYQKRDGEKKIAQLKRLIDADTPIEKIPADLRKYLPELLKRQQKKKSLIKKLPEGTRIFKKPENGMTLEQIKDVSDGVLMKRQADKLGILVDEYYRIHNNPTESIEKQVQELLAKKKVAADASITKKPDATTTPKPAFISSVFKSIGLPIPNTTTTTTPTSVQRQQPVQIPQLFQPNIGRSQSSSGISKGAATALLGGALLGGLFSWKKRYDERGRAKKIDQVRKMLAAGVPKEQIPDKLKKFIPEATKPNATMLAKKKPDADVAIPDIIAPNGKKYELNDIKYLLKNGYNMESAIAFLSTDKKYAKVEAKVKPADTPEAKKKLLDEQESNMQKMIKEYAEKHKTPKPEQPAFKTDDTTKKPSAPKNMKVLPAKVDTGGASMDDLLLSIRALDSHSELSQIINYLAIIAGKESGIEKTKLSDKDRLALNRNIEKAKLDAKAANPRARLHPDRTKDMVDAVGGLGNLSRSNFEVAVEIAKGGEFRKT